MGTKRIVNPIIDKLTLYAGTNDPPLFGRYLSQGQVQFVSPGAHDMNGVPLRIDYIFIMPSPFIVPNSI
jgi:hypothetical protein